MTRSTWDCAAVLEAIAGDDPSDPATLPGPAPALLDGIGEGIAGLRIGFDRGYATQDVDEQIAAAVFESVRVLESLGAEIVDVELPAIDPYALVWPTLCSVEALVAHSETFPSRANDYGPWFRGWLELGASTSAVDYARACDLRSELTGLLARAFAGIDMLACPAQGDLPHLVSDESLYDGPMVDHGPVRRRFSCPWDMNRAPTLTLPNGWTDVGLPTALQLVGSPGGEAVLCRAGYAFERATDFRRHPSV